MMLEYFILGSVTFLTIRGHEWGFGSCPSVAPMPNLSIDKFLGEWFVIEQFDTTSTCLTLTYEKESETSLSVTKKRQFYILDRAGLDHSNSYTGSLDIPFSNNQALLRVKWPLNAAGKFDYIIFDTDYINYAGVYDCQQIAFFLYRESASILSRNSTLDSIYVDRIKRLLEAFKVDVTEFNVIDHSKCRPRDQSKFKLDVDENTFKNFFNDATDKISNAAGQVATGMKDAANSVANTVRRFSENNPDPSAANSGLNLDEVEILNK